MGQRAHSGAFLNDSPFNAPAGLVPARRVLYDERVLSYRHAFHAGNAADVLKHTVLIFCLDYLRRKEKPFLCIDTHAGAGTYSLTEGYAAQNREWAAGIGRLLRSPPAPEGLPGILRRYLEVIGAAGGPALRAGGDSAFRGEGFTGPLYYPGSPAIIRSLLRPQDRAACFELHPADFAGLTELFRRESRFILRRENGLAGLKALLPPPSRRGCIFIDPSYEVKDDYTALPRALAAALKRFPRGLYIIWYPLLDRRDALDLPETLWGLWDGSRCGIELRRRGPAGTAPKPAGAGTSGSAETPGGLSGSGLIIYNPPWTFRERMEQDLPSMAALLDCTGHMRSH